MAFLRRFSFDPYFAPLALAHGRFSRPAAWSVGLVAMLGCQFVLPCATVYAQTTTTMTGTGISPGMDLNDGQTESITLGSRATSPVITKLGSDTPHLKIEPSASTGCGPGGDCDVTTKPLDLTHVPSEKELRMAGQMGGALSPLFPADVSVWQDKFDEELKKAGVPGGLKQQVAPIGAPQNAVSQVVNEKRNQIERLKKMNLEFGAAMQQWNKHEYRAAATKLQDYIKEFPESPWAGEAALHLGCDAKYNGRFNEAQERYEEILAHTSDDEKDPSWEIHQKAKLRWADLDIGLGRFNGATEKIANMLTTEKDWRRKAWEGYWFRSVNAQKQDARVLRACGTKALGFVLASVGKKEQADALARMTPTRQAGFSLAELSQLSAKSGTPMEGFRASVAQLSSLPLPFIIHYDFGDAKRAQVKKARGAFWPTPISASATAALNKAGAFPAPTLVRTTPASLKARQRTDAAFHASEEAGHFLVVNAIDTKTSRVHLFDPQEGRHYTLSFDQLNTEWSGAGLKLAKAPHQKLRIGATNTAPLIRLSMTEMRKYVGGCCGIARALGDLGPNGDDGDCPQGSPVWSVNPVSLNLNLYDIPLWYSTPVGPDVAITMSYNAQDGLNQNQTLGNKWSFGYGSYLVEDTGDGGGVVTIFMPLGAENNFLPQANGTYKADRPDNLNKLVKVGEHRFELALTDGTKYIYDIPTGAHSLQPYMVEQRDKYGYSLHFGYDGDNRLRTITDAQNKVTQLWYDMYGHLIRARTPLGREATWDYDQNGNMIQTVDIEGNPFGYVYDREVRLTELVTVQGSWQFKHEGPDGVHNADGYPAPDAGLWDNFRLTITNPLNQKEEYYYRGDGSNIYWHVGGRYYTPYQNYQINNSLPTVPKTIWKVGTTVASMGKVTETTLPSTDGGQTAQTSKTGYDPNTGWPVSFTDSRNRTTTLTRNAMGQVTSVTGPTGRTMRLEYAPNGLDLARMFDEQGNITLELTYSGLGQVAVMTVPSQTSGEPARQISFTYTPWGAPLTVQDPTGITNFSYNPDGLLQAMSRNGSTASTFTYDEQGRLSSATDAGGQIAGYLYDELNHVRKVNFSDGSSTESSAVCCGMPGAVKDRAGRWTYYDYDALKRLIRVQDPAGNTLDMDYDASGNMSRLTDAKGVSTYFDYDAWNRLVNKTYADGTTSGWAYDAYGRLSARRDAKGKITRYQYDSNDNLTNIDYPTMPDVSFGYDNRNRVVRVSDATGVTRVGYDALGRVEHIDGPFENDTLFYSYDSIGRLAEKRLEDGGTTDYSYDNLGRLEHLTSPAGTFDFSFVGDTGRMHQMHAPNATVTTLGYDALDRLNSVENKKGSGELISSYAYTYEGQNSSGNYARRGLKPPLISTRHLTFGSVVSLVTAQMGN